MSAKQLAPACRFARTTGTIRSAICTVAFKVRGNCSPGSRPPNATLVSGDRAATASRSEARRSTSDHEALEADVDDPKRRHFNQADFARTVPEGESQSMKPATRTFRPTKTEA